MNRIDPTDAHAMEAAMREAGLDPSAIAAAPIIRPGHRATRSEEPEITLPKSILSEWKFSHKPVRMAQREALSVEPLEHRQLSVKELKHAYRHALEGAHIIIMEGGEAALIMSKSHEAHQKMIALLGKEGRVEHLMSPRFNDRRLEVAPGEFRDYLAVPADFAEELVGLLPQENSKTTLHRPASEFEANFILQTVLEKTVHAPQR